MVYVSLLFPKTDVVKYYSLFALFDTITIKRNSALLKMYVPVISIHGLSDRD